VAKIKRTNTCHVRKKNTEIQPQLLHDSFRAPIFFVLVFFFSGEGPRSRRYGRTAILRLLAQPCDEDDDDDYYFCPFPSNGAPVE
jgi:hypothetical protein